MTKLFDWGSLLTIILTFILFVVALFVKGLTHDLLLEAGVLLVSVKLIQATYKLTLMNTQILREMGELKSRLDQLIDS